MFLQNILSESQKLKEDSSDIPLFIELTIHNKKEGMFPFLGVIVDMWHCDRNGYFAGEISLSSVNNKMLFSKCRQKTDCNGQVFFKSLISQSYPNIHLEILTETGKLLLVTQIEIPENLNSNVSESVLYAADGQTDNSQKDDAILPDNIKENISITLGSQAKGITIQKTFVISV